MIGTGSERSPSARCWWSSRRIASRPARSRAPPPRRRSSVQPTRRAARRGEPRRTTRRARRPRRRRRRRPRRPSCASCGASRSRRFRARGAPTADAARDGERCRAVAARAAGAAAATCRPSCASPAPPPAATRTPPPDSDWLRALKLPDFPVRWEPQVLRYLDYFKNDPKGRAVMSNWLRRAGRYRELFDEGARAPRPAARSLLPRDDRERLRERGPLARRRGRRLAVHAGRGARVRAGGQLLDRRRRDPERAADAAARYLKDLYVRFGSWYLVFAAYNAGYGAVLRSITNYNTNDYWELVKHESGLPWESSVYVPKILAAAIVGRNQARVRVRRRHARSAVRLRGGRGARGHDAGDGGARGGREDRGDRGAEPAAAARAARRPIAGATRGARAARDRRASTRRTSTRRARPGQARHRRCCASARRWTTSRARAASRCASCAA